MHNATNDFFFLQKLKKNVHRYHHRLPASKLLKMSSADQFEVTENLNLHAKNMDPYQTSGSTLFATDAPKLQQQMGAQWLSGRVLDLRPRGSRFEPHRRHCFVSLSKKINPSLILVQPRKTRPFITERLLMGRKESNLTN